MKIFNLEFSTNCYYIKRSGIVEKISFNNRTFYAKFERIDEPLTSLVLEQHFQREYTIAVPLLKKNRTNYLVLEYKGEEYQRFYHLIKHLFHTLNIKDYHIYQGKEIEKIQVFIEVNALHLKEAEKQLLEISNALAQKLTKKWKSLPSTALPDAYNIVTLPYSAL